MRAPKSKSCNNRKNSAKAVFEAMESRRLMASSIGVYYGTLQVNGTDSADRIEVKSSMSLVNGVAVPQWKVTVADSNGNLRTNSQGQQLSKKFSKSQVLRIEVNAGGGNDAVLLGTTTVSSLVRGGAGNDLINTGSGSDYVWGEAGNDNVTLGDGLDYFDGGAGNDSAFGGAGGDKLYGGDGNDSFVGEGGNDLLAGDAGLDILSGGGGTYDQLVADRAGETLSGGERVTIQVPGGSEQDDSWSCGPNSASRLLRSYGINASYSTLRSLVKSSNIISNFGLGTTPPDLEKIMDQFRSTQRQSGASFDKVLSLLGQGKPVVALIGWGAVSTPVGTAPTALHYIVLTGFDSSTRKVFYTDTDGTRQAYSYSDFQSRWNWPGSGAPYEALKLINVLKNTILW